MVLPYEYFKSQTYITDLQRLKDRELYFIIQLFYTELQNFNKAESFDLTGLFKACCNMKDLIKDLQFILNGYLDVILEHNITFCEESKSVIYELLDHMDKIEFLLNRIKNVRRLKRTVNHLADNCLLNIRLFHTILSDFIFNENGLWR